MMLGRLLRTVLPAPSVPPSVPENCRRIRRAILRKELVSACFRDRWMVFCPHALGTRHGQSYVLGYQFVGDLDLVQESFQSPRRWRWLPVVHLSEVTLRPGRWLSGDGLPPVLEDFEAEVQAA